MSLGIEEKTGYSRTRVGKKQLIRKTVTSAPPEPPLLQASHSSFFNLSAHRSHRPGRFPMFSGLSQGVAPSTGQATLPLIQHWKNDLP